MAETITVHELMAHCKAAIGRGLGNKKILISSDDEGNEYHELFFAFTKIGNGEHEMMPDEYQLHGVSLEDAQSEYIILG